MVRVDLLAVLSIREVYLVVMGNTRNLVNIQIMLHKYLVVEELFNIQVVMQTYRAVLDNIQEVVVMVYLALVVDLLHILVAVTV